MRYGVALLVFSCLALSSCAPVPYQSRTDVSGRPDVAAHESPCSDSLYVYLRSRSLEDMSEREYAYFMQKDEACTEYQQLVLATSEETRRLEEASDRVQKSVDVYILLSVLAGLAGVVALIMSQ